MFTNFSLLFDDGTKHKEELVSGSRLKERQGGVSFLNSKDIEFLATTLVFCLYKCLDLPLVMKKKTLPGIFPYTPATPSLDQKCLP